MTIIWPPTPPPLLLLTTTTTYYDVDTYVSLRPRPQQKPPCSTCDRLPYLARSNFSVRAWRSRVLRLVCTWVDRVLVGYQRYDAEARAYAFTASSSTLPIVVIIIINYFFPSIFFLDVLPVNRQGDGRFGGRRGAGLGVSWAEISLPLVRRILRQHVCIYGHVGARTIQAESREKKSSGFGIIIVYFRTRYIGSTGMLRISCICIFRIFWPMSG
ncbi:hypothetical protein F4774DRAFT_371050 [Daldinia eschscholtzii]|nr:hypothetical protein F4774DRAFT_371050 [Daldinia eschscholtzii]